MATETTALPQNGIGNCETVRQYNHHSHAGNEWVNPIYAAGAPTQRPRVGCAWRATNAYAPAASQRMTDDGEHAE